MDQALKRADHERAERLVETTMTSRKLTAIVVLALLSTTPCAAKDIFNVVMKVNGQVQDHYQAMPGNLCDAALAAFREERRLGHTFILTLKEPPEVTGEVLEMACVKPDGTIHGPDGIVQIPKEAQ